MIIRLNNFYLQKLGNNESDYEDAFAPKKEGKLNRHTFSIAIADGATESSFSSDWANRLTRAFVKKPFMNIEALQTRTEKLSKKWDKSVKSRPLPWFAEEKVRLGAFATFLGVELTSNSNGLNEIGSWSAIAVGDSCLFQVRNDDLVCSFPISKSSEFGSSPILLSSNMKHNSQVWKSVKYHTSEWQKEDLLLLATDALACWFLTKFQDNEKPWNIFLDFTEDSLPQESFKYWASNARRCDHLKNDDITLLIIRL